MARPRKVWKKGGIDWGNVLVNASRSAASRRKKAAAAATRSANQRAREAERDRKRRAADAERDRKRRERESARWAREREQQRKRDAAAAKKQAALLEKEKKAKQKEKEKFEKHLLKLNGLYLEHGLPIKYKKFDLRSFAYDYEIKNGLTTASQFKKVTLPYLQKHLSKLLVKKLKEIESEQQQKVINAYIDKKLSSVPKQLSSYIPTSSIKKVSQGFLKNYLKDNAIDDIPEIADIEKDADIETLKCNAESYLEHKKDNLDQNLDVLIKAAKKQVEEDKKQAEEDKLIKEAETSINQMNNYSEDARALIQNANDQINLNKAILVELKTAYKKALFSKGKLASKGKELAKEIWSETGPLLDLVINLRHILLNLKKQDETKVGKLIAKIKHKKANELPALEEKFKLDYSVAINCVMKRFTNLKEACSYFSDDQQKKLLSGFVGSIKKNYSDSKHILRLIDLLES